MASNKSGLIDSLFTASPLARANVTLRQLRAFVALAQAKSFTAAAKQIHITQSALSALVRELEEEVGSRLFDRTTRSVEFTVAGLELLPVAQRVLHDLNGGLEVLRDLNLKRRGRVTVAVTPLLAASFVPSLCAALGRRFPELRVVVHDRLAANNIHGVRSGEADLAIGNFGPVSDDIALTLIEGSRVGVVVPRGHRFAAQRGVNWAQLVGEPLIPVEQGECLPPGGRASLVAGRGDAGARLRSGLHGHSHRLGAGGAGDRHLPLAYCAVA